MDQINTERLRYLQKQQIAQRLGSKRSRERAGGPEGEEMGKRTKRVIGALWASDISHAGEVEECWECVDFTHALPPTEAWP